MRMAWPLKLEHFLPLFEAFGTLFHFFVTLIPSARKRTTKKQFSFEQRRILFVNELYFGSALLVFKAARALCKTCTSDESRATDDGRKVF